MIHSLVPGFRVLGSPFPVAGNAKLPKTLKPGTVILTPSTREDVRHSQHPNKP